MFDLQRLLELLAGAGHPGPRRRSGRSLVFDCPTCDGHETVKMYSTSGRWVCWKCRYLNDSEGLPHLFLARALNTSIESARSMLYGEAPAHDLEAPLFTEEDEEEELPPTLAWDYHHLPIEAPGAAKGREYLEGRGVPTDVARQYGIRYSPQERRVYFPVEIEGRLVGWQGRAIFPTDWVDEHGVTRHGQKILSSPSLPRDGVLMFGDRIEDKAILTEGPVDAIKCHLAGPGNVCAMGKTIQRGQLDLLRQKRIKTLYLALDPDAVDEVGRLVRLTYGDMDVRVVTLPGRYKDLGEMPLEEAAEAVRAAEPAHPWHIWYSFGNPSKEIS